MKKHPDKSSRSLAVRSVKSGISIKHVGEIHKCNRTTIWRWLKKSAYGRKVSLLVTAQRSGRPIRIPKQIMANFRKDILRPATKLGFETDFWTARRLQIHLKKKFKIKVTRRTICRWLRKSRLSYHKPEKRYYEANKAEQRRWIEGELPKILKYTRKVGGILYFEDEASIQLAPVVGKTWGPIGKTLVRTVTGNRASVAVMSAITQRGDLVFTLLQRKIKSAEVIQFLTQLLKHHPRRHVVVVMDRASPHKSKLTKKFISEQKRLHVFYLPARSPKLNPDEKVWAHLKHQELRDHQATTKKSLVRVTRKKLHSMAKNKHLVRGIFYRCDVAKFMS